MATKCDWHWLIGSGEECLECQSRINNEVCFDKHGRILCLDCTKMILDSRDDYIGGMKQEIEKLKQNNEGV